MRKVRLAYLLPALQFIFAALVFKANAYLPPGRWSDAHTFCWAMNAPALFAKLLLYYTPAAWWPTFIVGLNQVDFFVLIGIPPLWFVVGSILDHWHVRNNDPQTRASVVGNFILLAMATVLFIGASDAIRGTEFGFRPDLGLGIGMMIWSTAMASYSGSKLLRHIRKVKTRV